MEMEKVMDYQTDISYAMEICRKILTPLGIWALIYDRATKREKMLSVPLIIGCMSVLCFILIPITFHTFLYEKDLNAKMKMFGPLLFCMIATLKYCYFGLKCDTIGRCIAHVENDWCIINDKHHRAIMIRNATIGRNLIILCVIFLFTGGISYHAIIPVFATKRINENLTLRFLAYPGYDKYFNLETSPTYEIIFFVHFVCGLIMHGITVAVCSLLTTFVIHACGQIKIIMARLNDLVEGKESKGTEVNQRLAIIVKDHVKTLRFSIEIEKGLREFCLMEVVASTLIICLLEYYVITEWQNSDPIAIWTYFVLLISFVFEIFIFCYVGELLVDQCKKVGAASYNIEWYRLSQTKGLSMVLLIIISNYPPNITAGKIFKLSLSTFVTILKTSVAYFNMIRTFTE